MMERYDYHLHTLYSADAPRQTGCTVDSLCQTAIDRGLAGIAITDHFEITPPGAEPSEVDEFRFNPAIFLRDVQIAKERYAGRLQIAAGVELGSPSYDVAAAKKMLAAGQFDFVLVSTHRVRDILDFFHLDYQRLSDGDLRAKWDAYLNELWENLSFEYADAAAHLTYPCRYLKQYGRDAGLHLSARYTDDFAGILKLLIDRGIALEVNTSGLRGALGATMPDETILRLYRDLGGELITVGSDSHTKADVGAGIADTYELLRILGFRYVTVYSSRTPRQVPLTKQ